MKRGPKPRAPTKSVCVTESDSFFLTARRLALHHGCTTLPRLMEKLIEQGHRERFYKLDIAAGALLPVLPDASHRYSIRVKLAEPIERKLIKLAAHYGVPPTKILRALVAHAQNAINPVNP